MSSLVVVSVVIDSGCIGGLLDVDVVINRVVVEASTMIGRCLSASVV